MNYNDEQEKNQINLSEKKEFYLRLLKWYSKRPMTEANCLQLCDQFKKKLMNDLDKENFNEMYELIQLFYEKTREAVENGTYDKFDELYREEILGDNKRKYDMRSLVKKWMIIPKYTYKKLQDPVEYNYWVTLKKEKDERTGKEKGEIVYNPSPVQLNENEKIIKAIKIKQIGSLTYTMAGTKEANASIDNYEVQIDAGKKTNKYFVYSDINPILMYDEEYRKMVIDELLSENNITLSNLDGYIGSIEVKNSYQSIFSMFDLNSDEKNDTSSKEKEDMFSYTYDASNDKYVLKYDAYAASAVYYAHHREEYQTGKNEDEKDR